VVLVIILIVVLAVAFTFFFRKQEAYSDNPKTWVEDKASGVKEINVEKVTKGKGYFNDINQQYDDGDIVTVFGYDGIYDGEFFENDYLDQNGKLLLEITPDLNPNDGIMQGIIVESVEDGIFIVNIFLDEDWRKNFGNDINILWGKTYQNKEIFKFNSISDGIYMNEIIDDADRFTENYDLGGIIVGNIDQEDIKTGNTEGVTIISLH